MPKLKEAVCQSDIMTRAAIKIQTPLRGFFARRSYRLEHKSLSECTDYPLMVRGNDPAFTDLIPTHASNDKVVLIGTSGLRTLEIACKLGITLPKIFLIDNSQRVIIFWRMLQRFMRHTTSDGVKVEDMASVFSCTHDEMPQSQDVHYFVSLCTKYGFDNVKRIILHTSVVPQNWASKETFLVLKNLINYHQYQYVYVYPSNIVACMIFDGEYMGAQNILQQIEDLNPNLTFHSDLVYDDEGCFKPKNLYVIPQHKHHAGDIYTLLEPEGLKIKPAAVCQGGKVVVMDTCDFFDALHESDEDDEVRITGEKRKMEGML